MFIGLQIGFENRGCELRPKYQSRIKHEANIIREFNMYGLERDILLLLLIRHSAKYS